MRAAFLELHRGNNAVLSGDARVAKGFAASHARPAHGQPHRHLAMGAARPLSAARTGEVRNPAVLSPVTAALFTPGVAAAELRAAGNAALLYAAETTCCTGFAPRRLADFTAGRLCARLALGQLGIADFALVRNADRTPHWPSSVVGSITHTDGFCAAVVADAAHFASIGIDAERFDRVTPEIHRLIFTEAEALRLDALDRSARGRAATIIFSAKEAFYKCQYALTHEWRDFRDVCIEWTGEDSGDFTVRPSATTQIEQWGVALPLRGRFAIVDEVVITGVAVRR